MKSPFIIGSGVYLRPLEKSDLNDVYLGWLNDPEVNQFLDAGIFPYTRAELERYYDAVTSARDKVILAVVELESGLHIGNVKLDPINWINRHTGFGIMIGDKSKWGKGHGTEVTKLAVEYAFDRLNLNKVSLGVNPANKAALKTYQKLGFVTEGTRREEVFLNGKYADALWMSILRDEYQGRQAG